MGKTIAPALALAALNDAQNTIIFLETRILSKDGRAMVGVARGLVKKGFSLFDQQDHKGALDHAERASDLLVSVSHT